MKSVYIREGENRDVDKDPQWFPGVQDGELLPAVVGGQDELLAVLLVTLVGAVRHQVTEVAQWDAGPVPATNIFNTADTLMEQERSQQNISTRKGLND